MGTVSGARALPHWKDVTMAKTGGDFLWKRLGQWGVKRVFGYPGDGINGIVAALGRSKGGLRTAPAAPRSGSRPQDVGADRIRLGNAGNEFHVASAVEPLFGECL